MVDGDVIGPVVPGAHLGAAEADDDADAHDAKHRKEGLPAKNRSSMVIIRNIDCYNCQRAVQRCENLFLHV